MRRRSSTPTAASAKMEGDPWEDLPACVAIQILGLLPVPQRLRCREVCKLWRSLLAAPHAWIHVDLSSAATGASVQDGTVTEARFLAPLKAASRAARGQAQTLDVSGALKHFSDRISTVLMRVVYDNGASLRTVRITNLHRVSGLDVGFSPDLDTHDAAGEPLATICALLTAAPNLSALDVSVEAIGDVLAAAEIQAVLGTSTDADTRARFSPVHVCALSVYVEGSDDPAEDVALGNAFLAAVPAHRPWLRRVRLIGCSEAPLPFQHLSPYIKGVGAMAGRLEVIEIDGLPFAPEWLPVLTHALLSGTLHELHSTGRTIDLNTHVPSAISADVVAQFCNALRDSCVEQLTLNAVLDEWEDAASYDAVLCALAGHRTLRVLELQFNHVRRLASGVARQQLVSSLAGLLAANSPALVSLDISYDDLGPDELARNISIDAGTT